MTGDEELLQPAVMQPRVLSKKHTGCSDAGLWFDLVDAELNEARPGKKGIINLQYAREDNTKTNFLC